MDQDKRDDKTIENHCPCSPKCLDSDLDELGYCPHLVGFTSDGQTIEPIVLRRRYSRDAKEWVEDGNVMVDGRALEAVQADDILINPEYEQFNNGVWHKANKWVSSRVYSQDLDRQPVPVVLQKKQVVRRSMAAPVVRTRAGMKVPESETTAPKAAKAASKKKGKEPETDESIEEGLP